MSILVDTSVWIDFLQGVDATHASLLERAISTREILIPDVALVEILVGVRSEKIAEQIQQELKDFTVINIASRALAVGAARNYRLLRSKGITIRSTIDLLIGTWCIEKDIPLLHNDRDYSFMEEHLGLRNAKPDLLN